MPAIPAGERALLLGLELVVELLHDPLLELLGRRSGVEAGRQGLGEAQEHARVLHVGTDGLGHAGILDLHGDVAAVRERRPVDLPYRGRGRGLLLEVLEQLLGWLLELLLEHALHPLPRHRWGRCPKRRELLLVELSVVLGEELGVDERGELPDLHRRPLHLAEHVDHLLCGLEVPAVERLRPAFPRAGDVGGPGAGIARALASDHRPHLGGPAEPSLWDGAVFSHAAARIGGAAGHYTGPPTWLTSGVPPSPSRSAPSGARGRCAACAAPGSCPGCSTVAATAPSRSRSGRASCGRFWPMARPSSTSSSPLTSPAR